MRGYRERKRAHRQVAAAAVTAAAVTAAFPIAIARAGTTWDGGGANNDWSTANNWNPNGVPATNGTAAIVFTGGTRLTPNLNLDWSISSLTFSASTFAGFSPGST